MYNYHYDQLNRLTSMDAYRGFDTSANSWSSAVITTDYKERIGYDANGNILKYLRNGISSVNTNMDSLTYNYYTGNNRLKYVRDQVTDNAYAEDIDNHTNTSNYTYDAIGNLKSDAKDSITLIKWNVYGKIAEIQRLASTYRPITNIRYFYDASGNRIGKRVVKSPTGIYEWTWYVRDAQGNVMATYFSSGASSNSPLASNYSLFLTEDNIYGSSRLGLINRNVNVKVTFTNPSITNFERGNKSYELTNHLGNVLATISDKKIPILSGNYAVAYNADVVTANDYAPFGSLMPGRKYTAGSVKYRYRFNGKENDNDVKGEGNQQDYGMRILDTRLGRFLSVDPITKKYPELTPYQFASNTPIQAIDLDGLEQYHFSLSFNQQNKPLIKKTNETHFQYEHWRMGTARVMGFDIPFPERYYNEDHKWVVHTGVIHEGNVPDNSRTYQMEITRTFDTQNEMREWVSELKPSDLKAFDDNYSVLDQVAHHLNNAQEIYQDSRPGKIYHQVYPENLNEAEQKNLKRFNKSKPANSTDVELNRNLHTGDV